MAIDRTGINSLNADDSDSLEVGAPKLRLTGNKMAGGPYNLGSDRKNAAAVWQNMDEGDKSIYNFNFEFFLQSGDWMDQIQGSLQTGDRQMASAPHPDENWDALWQDLREKGEVPESIRNLQEFKNWFHNQDFDIDMSQRNRLGIMKAAQGGRIGYRNGSGPYQDYLQDLKDGLISSDTTFNEWLDDNAPDPDHDLIYAQGGRAGYGLGSLVKGIFKGAKKGNAFGSNSPALAFLLNSVIPPYFSNISSP